MPTGYSVPAPAAPVRPPYPGARGYGTRAVPAGPPRKKRRAVLIGLGGVFGVLLLFVAIGAIGDAVRPRERTTAASTPAPTYPTAYSPPAPTRYTAGSAPSASDAPGTRATSSEPAATTRAEPTPAGPRPVKALADNPLFERADIGLPNRQCTLSRWGPDRDRAAQFFESGVRCLDAVWSQVLAAAGLPFESPHLVVASSGQMQSPCGSAGDSFAAYYCPTNRTIYMPLDKLQIEQYGAHPGIYLPVLAHEYGHHVQQLSGVSDAMDDARYDAGADSAAGLELSRRLELQAQCFSGMFLGSAHAAGGGDVDRNIYTEAWNSEDRGDHNGGPRDHGSDRHAIAWWQQGATKNRVKQCNTWASNSSDVS
ncbi:neutral zinc metallopeptidase [Amycolatopsis rubida]|uniref:neutral zinc metallopeptidase n=1 Tax=Amycolatopsis rubida TaxID=112413 RepID=UPI001FCA762A|nr:neutral zinc metallopeptidase [Amycolatopsis rubida]